MREKTKLDGLAWILTIILPVALGVSLFFCRHVEWKFIIILLITIAVFISMLLYSPLSIAADKDFVTVRKIIGKKRIPISAIEYVQICYPSLERGFKLCASGGFAGYYGYYNDHILGSYFAYYGDRKECFLIHLRDGRQYVLGCKNADGMARYIQSQIKES